MYLSEQHTHALEIIYISVCGDACKAFRELLLLRGCRAIPVTCLLTL